jgi:hypothetical protein
MTGGQVSLDFDTADYHHADNKNTIDPTILQKNIIRDDLCVVFATEAEAAEHAALMATIIK